MIRTAQLTIAQMRDLVLLKTRQQTSADDVMKCGIERALVEIVHADRCAILTLARTTDIATAQAWVDGEHARDQPLALQRVLEALDRRDGAGGPHRQRRS